MRVKYSIDDDNRLVVSRSKETLPINGSFSVDEANRLIYRLNEPRHWRLKYQLPEKMIFTGKWSLDANNDLQLKISQSGPDLQQNYLTLRGELISCESDKLVFELKTIDKNGLVQLGLLKLSGSWAADELNRIYFAVSKKENPDILTLEGAWQINQNQQLIYTYEKQALKTKNRSSSTLTFSGFWKISSVNQLTYILSQGTNSKFDFRVQVETPNVYPKKGVIKYRLGIGLKGVSAEKVISLYGTWKISRKLGVSFDMDYGKGNIKSLDFGAELNFNKDNEIIFNLKDNFGKDLGIGVVFNHRF